MGIEESGLAWVVVAVESVGAPARHDTNDRPASPRIETIVQAAGPCESKILTLRRITV
jgi:hypothetical protein